MFNSKKASVLKRKRFHKKIIGSLIIVFLIFSVSFFIGRDDVRKSVFSSIRQVSFFSYEVISTVSFAPIKWIQDQFGFLGDVYSVYSENNRLKKEMMILKNYHNSALALHDKNQSLKKQLFFTETIKRKYKTVRISKDASEIYRGY